MHDAAQMFQRNERECSEATIVFTFLFLSTDNIYSLQRAENVHGASLEIEENDFGMER